MSTQRFYPHRTAPEEISLNVETEAVQLRRSTEGAICIYDSNIESVPMRVSALLPANTLQKVLDPSEQATAPVELLLVYRSVESRKRGTWKLAGDGTVFETVIVLDRKDWIGTLQIEVVLARTRANSKLPHEFASEKGSILSWSNPVRILFDEPPSPPGGTLEIDWMDFRELDWLESAASGHIFAIDTRGSVPRLLLNLAVTGAYSILTSNATHGTAARVRDATYSTIVHQAWTSLLGMAVSGLTATSDTEMGTGPDPAELAQVWHRDILEDWAQHLFPGFDYEEAFERLVQSSATPAGIEDVLGRIPTAIQARFETFKAFEGLTRELIG